MSIANYGQLKTAVASYLNRSDLTSYIPDFIKLSESRMYYGGEEPYRCEPLRIPAMQATDEGAVAAGAVIDFPIKFIEMIRLVLVNGGTSTTLLYSAPDTFTALANRSGLPTAFTYLTQGIATDTPQGATYLLDYYQAFDEFSLDADTNWLLTYAPGIYLYGALLESAPFMGDANQIQIWFGLYKSAVAALNRSTKRSGPLATRVVM